MNIHKVSRAVSWIFTKVQTRHVRDLEIEPFRGLLSSFSRVLSRTLSRTSVIPSGNKQPIKSLNNLSSLIHWTVAVNSDFSCFVVFNELYQALQRSDEPQDEQMKWWHIDQSKDNQTIYLCENIHTMIQSITTSLLWTSPSNMILFFYLKRVISWFDNL